tara:strand:+ start:159 stop:389 length:231 start_codon:yes stop_codon:yes gene_type:complete
MTIKFKRYNTSEYITAKPLAKTTYGYIIKHENDFDNDTIWACGFCNKDFEIIECIMTANTKREVTEILELNIKNIN